LSDYQTTGTCRYCLDSEALKIEVRGIVMCYQRKECLEREKERKFILKRVIQGIGDARVRRKLDK
jgi:hypothetical protein